MTLITLNRQEQRVIEQLIASTSEATTLRRAQALLWLSQGEPVAAVAERLQVTRQAVCQWATRINGCCANVDSLELAQELGIAGRLLPRATPELTAMDHLWRSVKGRALADRPTLSIDKSADAACQDILEMSRGERLRKAGVLSGDFWLTK